MNSLFQQLQNKLNINVIDFHLNDYWNSHLLIDHLRNEIAPLMEEKLHQSDIPFDPQDLEHQTLFFLSTYNAGSITKDIIQSAIDSQYRVIRNRLLNSATKEELDYLFRGLKKFYPDLNIHYRLKLKREDGQLVAVGDGRRFEVEFKRLDDKRLITLFTDSFHYIHQSRTRGDTFALFFKGDKYPWAIETTERSVHARSYKRAALLAHGFHPDKGIELTRLYTLPGSPLNAISVLDSLVNEYYKNTDIQVLFTKVMPSYSKSKSTTISGGLNKVLCVNKLEHAFVRGNIDGHECWKHVSRRWIENNNEQDFKYSTESFGLLPAVDVYMEVNKREFQPLPILTSENKVIYFDRAKTYNFNL